MNAPLQFVPKYERDAARNLKQFVAHCRNEITAFGKNLSFDADVWDVSDSLKRKSSNSAISLVFSDWNTTRSRQSSPMSEPFKSLVKAYLRYQQAIKLDQIGVPILSSFRSLDFALVEFDLSSRPWMCSSDVLNRAATLLLDRYSPGAAYRAGRELALFVSFLNGLLPVSKTLC